MATFFDVFQIPWPLLVPRLGKKPEKCNAKSPILVQKPFFQQYVMLAAEEIFNKNRPVFPLDCHIIGSTINCIRSAKFLSKKLRTILFIPFADQRSTLVGPIPPHLIFLPIAGIVVPAFHGLISSASSVILIAEGPIFLKKTEEDITMSDRLINIDNLCTNPDNHAMHLCELTTAGKTAVIEKMTKNPTFICGNCGKKANTEGALCAPGPFHD